jgi:O-antigen ligase
VFRAALNDAAVAMFIDQPLLGVGLNHFALSLPAYDRSFDEALDAMEGAVAVNERPMAAVHNYYLLILAETGLLGLVSMVFFLCAIVWRGIRAVRRTSGALQAISIGLVIGVCGLLLEEAVDFSLSMDPALFTFALFAAILSVAPSLERPRANPAEPASMLSRKR